MKNIGTNETISDAGACTPTATTMPESTAASEYAGAVELIPMTRVEKKPRPFFRPLSSTSMTG